jgi:hypothetical protein
MIHCVKESSLCLRKDIGLVVISQKTKLIAIAGKK